MSSPDLSTNAHAFVPKESSVSDTIDWRQLLLESVVGGVSHTMSNRVTALASIAEELKLAPEDARELADLVKAEAARCQDVVASLRSLSGGHREQSEALLLADVLTDARAIAQEGRYRVPGDWRLDIEVGLMPVLGRRTAFVQYCSALMLCTLYEAGRRVSAAHVTARGDERSIRVVFTAEGAEDAAGARPLDIDGLKRGAGALGGELSTESLSRAPGAVGHTSAVSFELRLPTLSESRRRQRENR
jgi:hypothetical protein